MNEIICHVEIEYTPNSGRSATLTLWFADTQFGPIIKDAMSMAVAGFPVIIQSIYSLTTARPATLLLAVEGTPIPVDIPVDISGCCPQGPFWI